MSLADHRARFDALAARYDETRGGEARGARFAGEIAGFLGSPGRVLELGVGTGVVATALAGSGHEVVGIDVSWSMLTYARRRLSGRIAQAEGARLPFPAGAFADVYAIWVLHMVGPLDDALREVRRVLRPGGRFLTVSAANPPGDDLVSQTMHRVVTELAGGRPAPDHPTLVARAAPAAGFEVVVPAHPIRQVLDRATSPATAARNLEARSFSHLQDVDDGEWQRVVQPAIEELRASPDAEADRPRVATHELVVLQARS